MKVVLRLVARPDTVEGLKPVLLELAELSRNGELSSALFAKLGGGIFQSKETARVERGFVAGFGQDDLPARDGSPSAPGREGGRGRG